MVVIQVQSIRNASQSARGLMFRKNIISIFFKTRWGVHTFFVKQSIDVVVLDDQSRVCILKENLKPWRVFVWNPKYSRILELPKGMIQKKKLRIGIQVTLVESEE